MAQNRSSAVMQQRSEPHDSLDDFPTPPWATRALCHAIMVRAGIRYLSSYAVREPTANRGHMARTLGEYFGTVHASDIHDYGQGYPVRDFLFGSLQDLDLVDWTICNPPFRLAERFIERALGTSITGVAVFVRSAFLEGQTRYRDLFSQHPPRWIFQFAERVILHKGKLVNPNVAILDPVTEKMRKPTTATAYCWIVWEPDPAPRQPTEFHWIAPCRQFLERPGDYPDQTTAQAEVAQPGGLPFPDE